MHHSSFVEEEKMAATFTPPHRMDPQVKRRYTRALCRIYLTDYVCTHQSLPEVCRDDLYNELEQDLLAYKSARVSQLHVSLT